MTYTQDNDEQEIDVCNIVELEENILRDKGQRRILGRSDLIPRVVCLNMAVLVFIRLWKRDVEVYFPRRSHRFLADII